MNIQEIKDYYSTFNSGYDSFHKLMQKRVKKILVISTLIDAFILEKEGMMFEKIFSEFNQLNLSNTPLIEIATTPEDVEIFLAKRDIDLIFTFLNVQIVDTKKVKKEFPNIPIVLLLSRMSEIMNVKRAPATMNKFTCVFAWKRKPKLLVSIIKLHEDKMNLEHDTKYKQIRLILFVEEDFVFASNIVPLLYAAIFKQTQIVINSERNEENKRTRMRERPKIIFSKNWEEASVIYETYKDKILAVISSSKYVNKKNEDEKIGYNIIDRILNSNKKIPLLLLCNNQLEFSKTKKANEPTYKKDKCNARKCINNFLLNEVGFGYYQMKDSEGNIYVTAKTLSELDRIFIDLPEDVFIHSANKNVFSRWLITHGEFDLSEQLHFQNLDDFDTLKEAIQYIRSIFHQVRVKKHRGKIVKFSKDYLEEENQVVLIRNGSLGGKGRGIAFMNSILVALNTDEKYPEIDVSVPRTAIIGTEEFDDFLINNSIVDKIKDKTDSEIDQIFLDSELSQELIHNLRIYEDNIKIPIAIRSSGLLEDSQAQPFAGVYRTLMLPNNSPDSEFRLLEILRAIKLVFASVFLEDAVKYRLALHTHSYEEKMAVIIQEVVGTELEENVFAPLVSGVGQSYNYYPKSPIKTSDCLVSLGVGLGAIVVDGEANYQYSPNYPKINYLSQQEIVRNNQRYFYSIDLKPETESHVDSHNVQVVRRPLSQKQLNSYFKPLTSVWDYRNNRFLDAKYAEGHRVLTFRMLTYFNKFGISSLLKEILEFSELTTGYPSEIEFALKERVYKDKPNRLNFNMLQVRPLNLNSNNVRLKINDIDKNQQLLMTSNVIGNGEFGEIRDVVFILPEKYNNLKTYEMSQELALLNAKFSDDEKYVLIG
ncbi:MAG: PEP/pyruvate-binding domain-containing protein, partial [Candidatus Cloacimonadota bacterium]|nr:PEP/pyruvate-binding domain-containing protein [Candidatus Cloacimonadota bacterium]